MRIIFDLIKILIIKLLCKVKLTNLKNDQVLNWYNCKLLKLKVLKTLSKINQLI